MESHDEEKIALQKSYALIDEVVAEREEVLRHKWFESEKAGHEVTFEKALVDWIVNYRTAWREKRAKK